MIERRFICKHGHTSYSDGETVPPRCLYWRSGDLMECGQPMTHEVVPLEQTS